MHYYVIDLLFRKCGVWNGQISHEILWQLRKGTKRYNELKRTLPNITDKMLAQQLKELEAAGIIIRKVYPVVPPKVEYSLSEFGLRNSTYSSSNATMGYQI